MSSAQLVNQYLQAFYSGDLAKAGEVVSDDFHFKGPFVEAASKESFLASAAGLVPMVRGHRLLRQWEDGDEVSSIYEVRLETPAGKGSVTMSEWHSVRHGKLISGRVILDTAAFRALLPAK